VNPTWLIGALFKFLTRIGVISLAKALTPQSPSGLLLAFGSLTLASG